MIELVEVVGEDERSRASIARGIVDGTNACGIVLEPTEIPIAGDYDDNVKAVFRSALMVETYHVASNMSIYDYAICYDGVPNCGQDVKGTIVKLHDIVHGAAMLQLSLDGVQEGALNIGHDIAIAIKIIDWMFERSD